MGPRACLSNLKKKIPFPAGILTSDHPARSLINTTGYARLTSPRNPVYHNPSPTVSIRALKPVWSLRNTPKKSSQLFLGHSNYQRVELLGSNSFLQSAIAKFVRYANLSPKINMSVSLISISTHDCFIHRIHVLIWNPLEQFPSRSS